MTHYPNKSDWDERFWRNNYHILVTTQGIEFMVNADDEQDALDYIINYAEEHYPGLLWSNDEVKTLAKEGSLDDYICGGNHGRYLSTHNVHIEHIKRKD